MDNIKQESLKSLLIKFNLIILFFVSVNFMVSYIGCLDSYQVFHYSLDNNTYIGYDNYLKLFPAFKPFDHDLISFGISYFSQEYILWTILVIILGNFFIWSYVKKPCKNFNLKWTHLYIFISAFVMANLYISHYYSYRMYELFIKDVVTNNLYSQCYNNETCNVKFQALKADKACKLKNQNCFQSKQDRFIQMYNEMKIESGLKNTNK